MSSTIDELAARGIELSDDAARELDEARALWPEGPLPDARFADYVAARKPARIRAIDLYLAWWCTTGDAAAIEAFEARFAEDLVRATARFRDQPADELRQALRVKLFVGGDGTPPKITDYAGAGSLRGWLRVTALRSFVDAVRATRRRGFERELDDELLGLAAPVANAAPALAAAIKVAFAAAVTELLPRERVFLRHVYLDRQTLDQIAARYSIHRATVARTLASAREKLVDGTRAQLVAATGIAADELSTVIRSLDGNVELSLSRVLGP